ncbi:hypothetical protein D9756_007098 [Leucocoprinus leucothites]|uniref:Uncharacterized protein n=1 Tax=Leucocoprinus leucothites TaxID=201217 RepID=A0A8H5FY19_9AGAR|nr:hypothetical protein D9756_007098 [Leucoagaricus leucothites]
MVSTASAAAQANELEKKRKQTLERAKANHLSRQLQMRLQYARLKVEHGWQRQNLNEVENLYFHHSHLRSPKPCPPNQTDPMPVYTSSKHYPSYRSWLQSQSGSSIPDALPGNLTQETNVTAGKPSPSPPTPAMPPPLVSGASDSTLLTSSTPPITLEARATRPPQIPIAPSQMQVPDSQVLSSLQNEDSGTGTPGPSQTSAHFPLTAASTPVLESAPSSTSLSQPQPSTSPPFTSGNTTYMPAALTSTPMTLSNAKMSPVTHKNKSVPTTKDMFGLNTTSLTYDSFWSGLQSKSYPTMKSGGPTTATTPSAVNRPSGVTISGSPHGRANNSSFSPAPAPNQSSTPTSTPTPSPSLSTIPPQVQSSPSSSSTSSSTSSIAPSAVPATAPSLPPSFPAPTPLAMPLPLSAQPLPPQVQMTMPSNFVPWTFAPAQSPLSQPHLIPTSFLANPAAFPFLANLSASYAQAFGAMGVQGHPPIVGVPVSDGPGAVSQAAAGVSAQTSNVPMSPGAPPVATAFVGQQES